MNNKPGSVKWKFIRSLFFVWLLPVFFILHGLAQHLFYIPINDAFFLLIKYWFIELLLIGIFFLLLKDWTKSLLSAFLSLFLFSFFGAIEDLFKSIFGHSFLSRYIFLIPFIAGLWISGIYFIWKRVPGRKLIFYLNSCFVILITIEAITVFYNWIWRRPITEPVAYCKSCNKPDVYLIVFDEYAGNEELKNVFGYDNSPFLDSLRSRNFKVIDSSISNYDKTPFSISSLLNMKYHSMENYEYTDKNMDYCYRSIARNPVVDVFEKQGYHFLNFSIFDFKSNPAIINKTFLVSGINLITSQTLLGRFKREVFKNILTKWFPESKAYKSMVYSDLGNNEKIFSKTLRSAEKKDVMPKFVYSHLMMPHFPYYFDSTGKMIDIRFMTKQFMYDENLYLSYLKYTNKKIIALVDTILKKSDKPPVILLLSDHGFRYVPQKEQSFLKYSNLAAIFLPRGDYKAYYPTMSNVNQMRVLLNQLFGFHYPILEDKRVY